MVVFRSNFRDLEEWEASSGFQLNTSSNEACKMYDATITQFCGWYEDNPMGGIEKTMSTMINADAEFVLGRAFELELTLMGGMSAVTFDKDLASSIEQLNKLVAKKETLGKLTELEKYHTDVVNLWAQNDLKRVTQVLEKIITLFPNDFTALKMAQDTYFMLGKSLQMRNSFAGSISQIPARNPLKGYAHGMFAFALEESNMYDESQVEVMKSLALIPHDTWAIHNYAHCLEMQAKTEDGIKWMYDRKSDWKDCDLLACHQYWHTALFHINKSQFDDAIDLLDKEVLTRCCNGATSLNLHDGVSMVYRMELADLFKVARPNEENKETINKRWTNIYESCKTHKDEHLWGFNDAHYMLSFLGMDDLSLAREFIDSLDDATHMASNIQKSVVKPLLEAMYQYKIKNYSKCVDLLEEIRFDIIQIGGSHAQRDVFEQLLIVAGLKSDRPAHNKLAQRMLTERDQLQGRRTVQSDLLAKQAVMAN